MTATICNIRKNGLGWVLCVKDEFGKNAVDVPISDSKRHELAGAGIEVEVDLSDGADNQLEYLPVNGHN
jgi:hypothetical protein